MTPDRRSLGLPAFSESATDAPLPAQATAARLLPVEQGADFRQPPGVEDSQLWAAAERPAAVGGLTFSDPDRQI
ncbi:hypothetical protein AB0D08_02405 [Kitasatospora sp. NPDC048540]|uniref:hypothetical protein n=1 Tax=Kitasatospora sp. NPDC048540 TaxID=3155634 RepID=UPI0033F97D8D